MRILALIISLSGLGSESRAATQFEAGVVINSNAVQASVVLAVDIDGDGDLDVVSASTGDNKVAWYANEDGMGTFSSERLISTSLTEVLTIHAADLDGDGDIDILSAAEDNDRVVWFENMDGAGSFGSPQTVTTAIETPEFVYAADLDGDGDLDVLSSSTGSVRHKLAWYKNDGQGNFGGQRNLIPGNLRGVFSARAGDLDGDGDLDIVYGTIDQVLWLRNTNGRGTFSARILLATGINGWKNIQLADMDNDGDLDVVFASARSFGTNGSIQWYKNNGSASFTAQPPVDAINADDAWSVYPADLDEDGDLDIVAAARLEDTIAWYRNRNAQGVFSSRRIISANAAGATSVFSADLDGDGDMDVISASGSDNKITWYRNTSTSPNSCNNVTISGQIGISNVVVEACEQLSTGSRLIMTPSAAVVFAAGEGITLNPGFIIQQGGILQAKVCGQSLCQASTRPMEYGCHSCVNTICDLNSSCCTEAFTEVCQAMVASACDLSCE